EPAVLACASLRSSRDFAAEIERWAAASPELATSILALAARIQRGEILARMLKGASSLDAAQSLASFLARLGPAEAIPDDLREILEDDAVLALRVASALVRSGPLGRKEATGADAILRVAARFPRLRPCVFALTLDCSFEAESIAIAQDLLEALCRLPDSGPLWLMALAIADSDGAAAGLPGWLTAGFAGLLRRPGDVASALAQLPADQRREVLESALQILPLEDAELFLEEAWARADDAMKPVLLSSLEELLDRASEHAGDGLSALEVERIMAEMASGMGFAPSRAEIRQMLSSPEGRQIARSLKDERGAEQKGTFPATARRIWVRFADRAIPCSVSYLELALEQDGSKLARMRAVERFLGHSAGDGTAMVDAVWSAEHARCRLASKALLEHLLGVLGGDRQKLAEALLQAIRRRLRQAIRGTLARAFASADARAAADGRLDVASPEILSARLEARLATTPRQARGRAPTASGRRRRGPRPAVQPGLFTFGDERG
ncbi:MAG TPA: hypothetical protein VLV17_06350, partial [Anaeromyxobacteraceae bacterium]|nr:hypothetical protein [Anaeromyxobacteraceae bacterium]